MKNFTGFAMTIKLSQSVKRVHIVLHRCVAEQFSSNTQMQLYSNTNVIRSQVNVYMEYFTVASKVAQPIIHSGTIHIKTNITNVNGW